MIIKIGMGDLERRYGEVESGGADTGQWETELQESFDINIGKLK